MAFFVYDPSGKPVGLLAPGEDPSQLRASGYTVSEVSDADVTTDANGQILVSIAALQQQQAFANSLQAAAALRQVEQNQINAYGAQTTRLGQVIPLVGQTQNYGLLANITAGDARAPYLSVPAGLSRMAGPSPIQADYAQAKTYSAKDASDFARKATEEKTSAENQASGGRKPLTGTTQAPKAAPAVQAATQPRPTSSTPTTVGSTTYGNTPTGGSIVLNRHLPGDPVAPPGGATPAARAAAAPAGAAAGSAAVAASSAPAANGSAGANPAAAWQPRAFAGNLSTGAGSGTAFNPAYAAYRTAQGIGPMAAIEQGQKGQGGGKTPKYINTYHNLVESAGFGHGSAAREAADARAGINQAQALHEIKHGRNPYAGIRAAAGGSFGGTDMARPSMFGGPSMPSPADPTSGFGFDPHAPTQTPDNLRQIAAILASPPSPSPSALEAAVRECWSLDPQSGRPLYTGHFADNAAKGTQAMPNGGLLGDQETTGDVSAEGGAEPPPPGDMPSPGGKPAMFAEGGTTYGRYAGGRVAPPPTDYGAVAGGYVGNDTQRGNPAAHNWVYLPGGYNAPSAAPEGLRRVGELTRAPTPARAPANASTIGPRPPAAAAPVAASGRGGGSPARPRAPAARAGGPRAEQPSAPSADLMRKVTNYYVAQFGGTADDATKDLQSGSADAANWLRSALGMAMAGRLDQYDSAPAATSAEPVTAATAAPAKATPSPTAAATADPVWQKAYQEQQARGARALATPPPAAKPNDAAGAVMGGVNNGLRLGGGRVTTAATAAPQTTTPTTPPHPDEVKAAIAGMTYADAVAYINSLYGRAASAVGVAPRAAGGTTRMATGGTGRNFFDPFGTNVIIPNPIRPPGADPTYVQASGEGYDPPDYTYDEYGVLRGENPVRHLAGGGTTFVARRPTMFNAGGQQFLVGEDTRHGHPSGADELVSIGGAGGQTVVHVDPLQRRGTGIPPAVAATANLAVPGSPYRPKVGIPASAVHPGRMSYADAHVPRWKDASGRTDASIAPAPPLPIEQIIPPLYNGVDIYHQAVPPDALHQQPGRRLPGMATGGTTAMPMDPSMGGGDPAAGLPDVIPVGNGIVLVRQPDGSYLPMDAQQMQAMLGSLPAGGGGDTSSMGNQMPMGAGPSPMAAGGTRVYGTVAPGATISRVGGQPSATGQVKVPGGKGGSTTQPFYAVQPFPNPEYALSRNVDQLTPDELQQIGLVTQNRAGYGTSQWAALQAKGRLMSQAPAALGSYSRPF